MCVFEKVSERERERERERLCLGFSCRMEVKSFCVESLCINVKIDSISATVFFSSLFLLYRFPLSLIPLTAFLLSLSLSLSLETSSTLAQNF